MSFALKISLLFWGLILLISTQGCAGIKVGGEVGIYRVDEQTSSNKTIDKPWQCFVPFMTCPASGASASNVQGS